MATEQQSTVWDKERIERDSERLESHAQRAKHIIENDQKIVPQFWINKYKKEASRNWDIFYKRNTTKFFKGTGNATK
jgi:methyltransferase-like protein 6